jgi:hypothetical protein
MESHLPTDKRQRNRLALFSIAILVASVLIAGLWNTITDRHAKAALIKTTSITFVPAEVSFPAQVVGTTANQTISVWNSAAVPVKIEDIALSGDFQLAGRSCTDSLAPAAGCSMTIAFKPTGVAARKGALELRVSGDVRANRLPLIGLGTLISVLPRSLNFPPQRLGSISAAQLATVRNTSKRAFPVGISVVGDFSIIRNGCKGSLRAGGICTVTLKFSPVARGVRTGVLNINSPEGGNTAGSQSVGLTGTGT